MRPADLRLEALAAIPGGRFTCDAEIFAMLRTALDPGRPPLQRHAASGVLARAALTEAQLMELAAMMRTVGPMEVSRVLAAFDRSRSESVGLELIAALRDSKALPGLRPDMIAPRLTNYPASVQAQGRTLLASLNTDAAKQSAHLESLAGALQGGDIRRGQAIFNSAKAACSACHAIGYLGGSIGPDLTRIGEIRTERDLLEAIVYPSASFVRSYEPMLVTTRSGEEFSGVVKGDTGDALVLATGVGVQTRIARADIVEQRPGTVSIMPQGLDGQLSRAELADLVAFLKGAR
jgi:putative heme-binding domain-containing protein